MELNVFSENVDGLGSCEIKRQTVFDSLNRRGEGIFMLQETHSTPALEKKFMDQFRTSNMHFSHGRPNSCGVLIAISGNYEVKILNKISDEEGRFIILDVEKNGYIYRLGNFYAPTRGFEQQQIRALNLFAKEIFESPTENIITGGDWNLYMTMLDKLDTMPDSNDNKTYRQNVKSFLEVNGMVDVWRNQNPDVKQFTWHRGNKRSRLDYFFCSEHLLNNLEKVEILPSVRSDHSLLHLKINSHGNQNRGKGFWKWNSDLIHDQIYVENVKRIIREKIVEYDIPDIGLKWDLIKLEIRNYTIPYCSRKKKALIQREKTLNEKYLSLFNQVSTQENVDETVIQEYNTVKNQLETILNDRSRGIILRSKVQWTEEGERNTSYFLRLERSNYKNKHIEQLHDETTDTIVNDPAKILLMQQSFYKKLYSETPNDSEESVNAATHSLFAGLNLPKISNAEKEKCENLLSEQELLKSVKAMKNRKSPGCSGFTAEFYKFFYNDIKQILLDSLNYDLSHGKLALERRRGILTLIPKKDKNRLFLKNWRPLTLLNTDYKILAKALANRLIKHLPLLVNDDQTGYITGRFMGCNIRLVEDIIIFTTENKVEGILLVIDFEKAFDSLRWTFIMQTLKFFGYGEKFMGYIKTMYNDIYTAVTNNGYISDWFKPERGVRQGCPLSPYLFLLSVEILACSIRQNSKIKGITINGCEIKISQLADDTTCFIKDVVSLRHLLCSFELYKKCSGLAINVDKTCAKKLGGIEIGVGDQLGLDWSEDQNIFLLGAFVTGDEKDHYELNFKPKIIKIKHLLNSWKCRKLSLKGKITVINSLALSKLIYLCSSIHVPARVYSEVKDIIKDFLWSGGSSKIAYDTLTRDVKSGGLKLIDLETKVKSLQISWIKRFSDSSNGKWKAFPSYLYRTSDLTFYFMCNQPPITANIKPYFYKTVQNTWAHLTAINERNLTPENIINQCIWNNRYITIENNSFVWRLWKAAGIYKIGDIFSNGSFLNVNDYYVKYGIRTNFLELLQIKQSVPFSWRMKLIESQNCATFANDVLSFPLLGESRLLRKTKAKHIYTFFNLKPNFTPNGITRWNAIFPNIQSEEWQNVFLRSFRASRETSLQSLQFRILSYVITCRKKLHEMKISDSPLCTAPNCNQIDNHVHFFCECSYVNVFWENLFSWLDHNIGYSLEVDVKNIILGVPIVDDRSAVLNYILLLAKYFIHKQRMENKHILSIHAFKCLLHYKLKIEKTICESSANCSFTKFQQLFDVLN